MCRLLRLLTEKPPPKAALLLYRAADGTLLLFPTAWIYVLPEPVILPPPYVHETVGRLVLDMADKWYDPPRPVGPPEKKPWMAVPGCRSCKAFQRGHQLIAIEAEKQPHWTEFTLAYGPRKDGGWVRNYGDVELCARIKGLDDERPHKLAHRIGNAVRQIFRVAEALDPLPPQSPKEKQSK